MRGVRREGVTEAAGRLQRAGLEQRVCECYAVVKQECDRLLCEIAPGDPEGVLGPSLPD